MKLLELLVSVKVDSKNVARQLRDIERQGESAERSLSDIGDGAERSQRAATGAFGRISRSLKVLRGDAKRGVEVRVDADASGLDRAGRAISGLRAEASRDVSVAVDVDTGGALGQLKAFEAARRSADGKDIDVAVDVDTGGAIASLVAFRAAAAGVGGAVSAMDSGLSAGGVRIAMLGGIAATAAALLTPLLGALASVGSLAAAAGAGVGLIAAPLLMVIGRLKEYHESLDKAAAAQKSADAAARSYSDAQRAVGEAQANAARTAERSAAAVKDAEQNLADARESSAEGIADAERGLADARRSGAQGVQDAERGLADARRSGAQAIKDAEANLADARRSGAQGIQDAEANLADARRDAAQSIADAERGLADARQSASESVASAEESLQSARDSLTTATRTLVAAERELEYIRNKLEPLNQAQATLNLAEARDRASDAQRDYNEAVSQYGASSEEATDAARNLEQAELDLQRTELETQETRKNGSDELRSAQDSVNDAYQGQQDAADGVRQAEEDLAQTRQDAARDVADAQQALSEAQAEAARSVADAQQALADAQRESSKGIQDATQDLADARSDAARSEQEAQRQLSQAHQEASRQIADAQRQLADAREAGAEQIADAEQGLADARRDAAQQVADAQKAVTDAQRAASRAAQDLAAAQKEAAAAAVGLSPALMALYNAAMRFKDAAYTAFGPAQNAIARLGTTILRDVTPALDVLGRASTATIGALRTAWEGFLSRFKMPTQQASIGTLLGITPQVVQSLSAAVGDFGLALINILAAAAPSAVKLAGVIRDIAGGMLRWSGSTGGVNAVRSAIAAAVPVFGALWNMVKQVGGALFAFGAQNAPAIATAIRMISGALTAVINGFSRLTQIFGPIVPITAALTPVFLGLMLIFGQVGSAVIGLLGMFFKFGGAIRLVAGVLLGPWGLAIAAVVAGAILLVRHFGGLGATFDAVKRVLAPLVPVFNRVKDAIQNLGTVIKGFFTGNTGTEQFKKAFASLPKPVQDAVRNIYQAWLKLRIGLQQVWNQIRPILTQVGSGIKTALGTALKFLVSQAKAAVNAFKQNWPAIKNAVLPVLQAVSKAIRTVLVGAFKFAIQNAKIVTSWFKANWPLIKRTVETVFNAVKTVISAVMKFVWNNVIKPIVGAIIAFWRNNWTEIRSILQSVWMIIKTIIQTTLKVVLGIIKAAMQAITGDWKGAWDTIKKITQSAWDAIKTIAREALKILGSVIKIAWDTIKKITQSAWEAVKNYIGDKIQAAKDRAKSIVESLKKVVMDVFNSLPDPVRKIFEAVGDAIWGPVNAAWNILQGVLNSIVGGIARVLEAVGLKDLAGKLRGAIGGESSSAGAGSPPSNSGQQRQTNFAKGGIYRQDPVGGVADGTTPRAVYGEAGKPESYTVFGRRDNIPYAQAYAESVDMQLVPKRLVPKTTKQFYTEGEKHLMSVGGILKAWERMGVPMHAYGVTSGNVSPAMWNVNSAIESKHGVQGTTYAGHGAQGNAMTSTDWLVANAWNTVAAGADKALGDAIVNTLESQFANVLQYIIWNKMANYSGKGGGGWQPYTGGGGYAAPSSPSGYHQDHVHASVTPDGQPGGYNGSAGGGAGTGILSSLWDIAGEAIWNRAVQPFVDRFKDDMAGGHVLRQAAGAGLQTATDAIKDMIISKAGSSGASSGGPYSGGGSLDQWLSSGLSAGGAFPNTSANVATLHSLAMEESGGDPNAVNEGYTAGGGHPSGLLQMLPDTFSANMAPGHPDIFDPVDNTASSTRYQKARYGVLQAHAPYARGGITGASVLTKLPPAVAKAFILVADTLRSFAGGRDLSGSSAIERGRGRVTDGITGIAGEAGRESIVPLTRRTPEGEHALRTAMNVHHPEIKLFARGGISGVPTIGWNLLGGDAFLGFGGPAAQAAISASSMWGGTGVRFGRGSDVYAEWSPGTAAGTTSSSGRMRVDPQYIGMPVAAPFWAHEIGHALGLGHNSSGLMRPAVGAEYRPTSAEIDTVRRLYQGTARMGDHPSGPPGGAGSTSGGGGVSNGGLGTGSLGSIISGAFGGVLGGTPFFENMASASGGLLGNYGFTKSLGSGGVSGGPSPGSSGASRAMNIMRSLGSGASSANFGMNIHGMDDVSRRLAHIERAIRDNKTIEIGERSIGKQAGANLNTARGYAQSREFEDRFRGISQSVQRKLAGVGR